MSKRPAAASGMSEQAGQRPKSRRKTAGTTTKRESMIIQADNEIGRWSQWNANGSEERATLTDKFWRSNSMPCTRAQHETKHNCSDNPSCVWGLGEYKSGVWAKSPASLAAVERPAERLREPLTLEIALDVGMKAPIPPDAVPVGLRNLGATCYVNSIVQALFMNPRFRLGIFKCGYPAPEVPEAPSTTEQRDEDTARQCTSNQDAKGSGPNTAVEIDVGEDDLGGSAATAAEQIRHDAKQGVLCSQLQWLFACLQESVMSSYTPSEIIKAMGLSPAYQQDVGEFYKLLLSSLERELGEAPCLSERNLIQNLHQGKFRHVTTCQGCTRESEMSATELPFYELQLQPRDGGSLQQSLQEYLEEEHLNGDNQYFCSHCKSKQDAVRMNELVKLPASLWFQLTRYHYDWNTGTKKKLRSRFSFPNVIDMMPFVGEDAQKEAGGQTYELVGVLVHTGSSANAGHYTAHLRSPNQQWWKFDDETITKLKACELGEEPEATAETAASKTKGKGKGKAKGKGKGKGKNKPNGKTQGKGKEARSSKAEATAGDAKGNESASTPAVETIDADGPGAVADQMQEESADSDHGVRTSTNAYMLIYRRRDAQASVLPGSGSPVGGCSQAVLESLLKRVVRENNEGLKEIEAYGAAQRTEMARIQQTKLDIEKVLKLMEDDPIVPGKPHFWIPTEYLKNFVTGTVGLGKVDNAAILCDGQHVPEGSKQRKLCVAPAAKRISVGAWKEIVRLQGLDGDRTITENDCCYDCADNVVDERIRELTRIKRDFNSLELLDGAVRAADDSRNVYMSKPWIKRWKARSKTKSFASLKREPWELLLAQRKKPQNKEAARAADEQDREELLQLNADLQCEHGNLVPDSSLWQDVSPDVWDFFLKERQVACNGAEVFSSDEAQLNSDRSLCAAETVKSRQSGKILRPPPKFPTSQVGCHMCDAAHQENIRSAANTKTQADEERKDEHLSLLFGSHACVPRTMYEHYIGQKENPLFVVATAWLEQWRQYIAPGKIKAGVTRHHPGHIDNNPLLCPHEKLKYDPMEEYKRLNFYHEHYTLIDKFQWQKLHKKYGGGPKIMWWQNTPFLQKFGPDELELQQKRTPRRWSVEEDKFVVELQGSMGDGRWKEKAKLFNDKFASDEHTKRNHDEIGTRWRKVLRNQEIDKSQTDHHGKRKAEALNDGAEESIMETQVATPEKSAARSTAFDKQDESNQPQSINLVDDDTVATCKDSTAAMQECNASAFEVCRECNKAREEEELRNQLNFANKTLQVKHVARVTEPSSGDASLVIDGHDSRRKSRRSRAGKAYQTYTVLMSSDETLSDLKLKVIQQATVDLFPNQMQMYNCGKKLNGDDLPLHVLSVRQGTILEMVLNEEIVGDYGDLFGAADDDAAEQGFAGTALY